MIPFIFVFIDDFMILYSQGMEAPISPKINEFYMI
jgi:hypothetical protein